MWFKDCGPKFFLFKVASQAGWMRFLYCQPNDLRLCCGLELKTTFHIDSRQIPVFFSCWDIHMVKWNKNVASITGIRKKPSGIDGSSVDNAATNGNLCSDEITFVPYSLHELTRGSWVGRGRGRILQGEPRSVSLRSRISASERRCLTRYIFPFQLKSATLIMYAGSNTRRH